MQWTWQDEEEFEEMMETYPLFEPAIERIVRQDAEADRLRLLEKRVNVITRYLLGRKTK